MFEDADPEVGFILVPDLKWTGEQMEDLYLQAIVHRRDITCLRELRSEHIPLLKNILNKGMVSKSHFFSFIFRGICLCIDYLYDCVHDMKSLYL